MPARQCQVRSKESINASRPRGYKFKNKNPITRSIVRKKKKTLFYY